MSKLKNYTMEMAEFFPKHHPRYGEPTKFKEAIINSTKKHTIRKNYCRWKQIIDEVNLGTAELAIKQWVGMPYRKGSRLIELWRYNKQSGLGIHLITDMLTPSKTNNNLPTWL